LILNRKILLVGKESEKYKTYMEEDGFCDDYGNNKYNEKLTYEPILKTFKFPKNEQETLEIILFVSNFLEIPITNVAHGPSATDVKSFDDWYQEVIKL
jgi:hypothetical protein